MKKLFLSSVIVFLLFSSCEKDLRHTSYPLYPFNNSGIHGNLSYIETKDKNITRVVFVASGMMTDTTYLTHLHTGTVGNLTGTLIYFNDVRTIDGNYQGEANWNETYDNAINSNTCFTMHNPALFSNDSISYVLAGNLGANYQ